MTKKHFEAFAHYISKVLPYRVEGDDVAVVQQACIDMVSDIAKQHNSNFDKERFRAACLKK